MCYLIRSELLLQRKVIIFRFLPSDLLRKSEGRNDMKWCEKRGGGMRRCAPDPASPPISASAQSFRSANRRRGIS